MTLARHAHLGEDQTVLEVDIFPLDVTSDIPRLVVPHTSDLERDIRRCERLHLERCPGSRIVFAEEV